MLRKINDEVIVNTSLNSHEKRQIEKKKAEAAKKKAEFNNKPIKFIKQGTQGKH